MPAADDAAFRAYPLRQLDAETAQRQLDQFFASEPGVEVVADRVRNRVLVRGNQQIHRVAAGLLAKLDQPPANVPTASVPPSPAQQLEAYPLTPATRDTLERLRNGWRSNPAAGDVRFAFDERTGQALVLAPAAAHEQIRGQLAQAGRGQRTDLGSRTQDFGSADGNPQSAIRNPQSNVPDPTASDSRLQLHNLTADQLHQRLERLLSRPLAVSTDHTGGSHSFVLEAAPGTGVTVSVSPATGELQLAGPPASAAAWRTVIAALDGGPTTDGEVTELVATKPASHDRVRQVLDVVQSQSVGPPRRAGSLASMLMQPAGTEAAANQPPAGVGEAAAQTPDAQLGLDPAILAQAAGELLGPVDVQYVEGLDVIILRGNDRDVERVLQIIEQIERLSAVTVPAIEVYTLENVDSRALGALLTRLYEQVLTQRIGSVNITPLGKPNALLLVGRAENVRMAIELIQRLDQPVAPTTRFQIFRLKNAPAAEAKTLIDDFFEQGEAAAEEAAEEVPTLAPKAVVVADVRTNTLLVSAGPRDLAEIAALVARIDSPSGAAVDQVRVFQLRNAVATEMAEVLRNAIQSQGAAVDGPADGAAPGARPSALEFRRIGGDPQQALRSGVLSGARISADARANSIIVTAPAESMELIAALIAQLDQMPNVAAELKVFTLENGDAVGLADMLRTLFGADDAQQQAVGGVGAGGLVRMQFSVDERTNSIIAAGTREDLAVVEAILLRLDGGDIRERITIVYKLKNAFAQNVSDALNNWLLGRAEAEAAAEVAISPFEQIEREVIIVPELASNSLLVSATPRYYKDIEQLIEQLDERPPMVMIQVLIAEVRLNDTDEFGVELGLQDSLLFDRSLLGELTTITTTTTEQVMGTAVTTEQQNIVNAPLNPGFNFNNQPLGNNGSTSALATAANLAAQGLSSFSVGRVNNELGFGGFVLSASSSSINVLLRALQEKRRLEVLSRPQIMALDGQVGIVQVGQQVPRITLASINEFGQTNSVQYVPVGLILRVQPRISPDGLVVMQIYAEKSEVGAEAEGIPISISANGTILRTPRIDSTQAETTVSALSGQTVVLSGLLTNRRQDIHRRVPLIADIPLLGDLFRYDSVAEQRTELLIILTPRIIHNKLDAEILKQVESSRMSWVLSDVVNLHGEAGLRGRADQWCDGETEAVYPTYIPQEGELLPAAPESIIPAPGPELGTPTGETEVRPSPSSESRLGNADIERRHVTQASYVAPTRLPKTTTNR